MTGLHVVLVGAAVLLVLLARPALAGALTGGGWRHRPVAELRRLWRKETVSAGMGVAGPCAAVVLGCDAGGTGASRAMRLLVAAGPVALLVPLIVAGVTGSARLDLLRDAAGAAVRAPMVLAACAVGVLGWADMGMGHSGLAEFASGRALAVLRVSAEVRRVAWVGLSIALVPPIVPDAAVMGAGVWAAKLVVVVAVLWVAEARLGRGEPAAGAPALAGVLGLIGALLALMGGPA